MIFAREVSDGLTSLVKQIDAATAKNPTLGSFVVFLGDEDELKDPLEKLAKQHGIKKTILTIDNPAGPPPYKIAKAAEITVIFYEKHKVQANHAFRKGELKKEKVAAIVKDLDKILPGKK